MSQILSGLERTLVVVFGPTEALPAILVVTIFARMLIQKALHHGCRVVNRRVVATCDGRLERTLFRARLLCTWTATMPHYAVSSVGSSRRSAPRIMMSTASNLNNDNMSEHHMSHDCPPQEWTTFKGKVSVLQTENASRSDHSYDEALLFGDRPRTSLLMELTDR